ncbi:unnamed protein product, partial [Allacma fusca]
EGDVTFARQVETLADQVKILRDNVMAAVAIAG